MNSIEVTNLTKRFGKFTSVDNISFEIKKGEVFGFLGANGAGKSTTIKMLCGILQPTSGDARVGGFSVVNEPEKIKKTIGYMSQKFSLYNDLTVEENIRFFGSIYGLNIYELKEKRKHVIENAGLSGKEQIMTANLATGFKQRLALGCAVIHKPEIVFLDEPTGGVDPVSRRNFWDMINKMSEEGITVFVTTHYLDEAEFCHRIVMIDSGRLIASGSPTELKKNLASSVVYEIDCRNIENAIELLTRELWIENTAYFGKYLHVSVRNQNTREAESRIIKHLTENGIEINRIEKILPSLEDVFVNMLTK